MQEKINLIYEAGILTNILYKNANRTGIFCVAYNLFNEMIKMPNLNITLHCDINQYDDLKKVIEIYYPNCNFNILTPIPHNKILLNYCNMKKIKARLKKENKIFKKNILQLLLIPYSCIYKLISFFCKNNIDASKYDVYFSPYKEPPQYIDKEKNINKYVLLHDVIPLVFPEMTKGANSTKGWFRKISDSITSSNYYFANSEYTKRDFIKHFSNIDQNKFYTTLLACNENFYPRNNEEIIKAKNKYNIPIDKKYLFSLCSIDPRKNLIRILKTYSEFINKHNIDDLYFVIGGGHYETFIDEFEKEVNNIKIDKGKILEIGYVDDEDLPALYSGAEWFVYTSMYEGFGLPPLEAMSCGCPVITSNNTSLPEVVGDAGIMIDWDSDEQHIQAYEQYYFNNELREKNRKKGLDRAKQFSWEKCATEILNTIRKNYAENISNNNGL